VSIGNFGFSSVGLGEQTRRANQAGDFLFEERRREPELAPITDWSYDALSYGENRRVASAVPPSLVNCLKNSENVFLKLPPPDGRWFVRFMGRNLPLLDSRSEGIGLLHDVMEHRPLDGVAISALSPAHRKEDYFAKLERAELKRLGSNYFREETGTQSLCTHDARMVEQYQHRLRRAVKKIRQADEAAGEFFDHAISYSTQYGFLFSHPGVLWVLDVEAIPYDARLVKDGRQWLAYLPDTSIDAPLILPDSVGLNYIARALTRIIREGARDNDLARGENVGGAGKE
jgi:hypothetical protein